jgi:hypothetical protein
LTHLDSDEEDPRVDFGRDIEETKDRASVCRGEMRLQESVGEQYLRGRVRRGERRGEQTPE